MAVRRTLAGLFAVPAVLLAPLLTGCSGDSSVADPPVQSSPTSSAPTGDPPAHESAEHFIRRWVAVSNAMEGGGSATLYLSMTHNCHPCSALARQITHARNHGGFYRSRGWTVKDVQPVNGEPAADVSVKSARTSFKQATNSDVQHYTGGELIFRIFYSRIGDSWRVTNVAQLAG